MWWCVQVQDEVSWQCYRMWTSARSVISDNASELSAPQLGQAGLSILLKISSVHSCLFLIKGIRIIEFYSYKESLFFKSTELSR